MVRPQRNSKAPFTRISAADAPTNTSNFPGSATHAFFSVL
jgi:hypothetical protein